MNLCANVRYFFAKLVFLAYNLVTLQRFFKEKE